MKIDDQTREMLIQSAVQARRWAYAPYSHFSVGAALLTASGKVYEGVNIENAAYSPTVCAERVAVFKAVSQGERHFIAIAVSASGAPTPCGVCRQVLAEFGLDTLVISCDENGKFIREMPLSALLPEAFTPASLEN